MGHEHSEGGYAHGGHTHKTSGRGHTPGHSRGDVQPQTGDTRKQCACEDGICETPSKGDRFRELLPPVVSAVLLFAGLLIQNLSANNFLTSWWSLAWYAAAYLPVGVPVIREAFKAYLKKDIFNEFSLMAAATVGAFCIGEYPEAVAVMLFYSVGELFQGSAVRKARNNIKSLLDIRPQSASVLREGEVTQVAPESVGIGETLLIRPGERVPLDGEMLSGMCSFDTAALTGESRPRAIRSGETVLAGMIAQDCAAQMRVTKKYSDSSLSRILSMVEEASERKSKTELFIRRFARIYTPVVFGLAVLITFLPSVFVADYIFSDWLYRALVFLVISCPCALVISVPLGYFGGIGAASRAGILFKGANFLDIAARITTVVTDKTGTLTKGVFRVREVRAAEGFSAVKIISYAVALEAFSTHPVARAIVEYGENTGIKEPAVDACEIAGKGLSGVVAGESLMVGNVKLLQDSGVAIEDWVYDIVETTVLVAIGGRFAGCITIADEVKEDAFEAIAELYSAGVGETIMLSGDKSSIVAKVARELGVDKAYGDLLPEDKVARIEELKRDPKRVVAFVGDGINDAPSLAMSDVGIAMGAMGSDAAIEVADVIIQTDQPLKVATAIRIARSTRRIVIQNITLAIGVKLLVLLLGAFGVASMWQAVFADVGVSLLAILNSVRILGNRF